MIQWFFGPSTREVQFLVAKMYRRNSDEEDRSYLLGIFSSAGSAETHGETERPMRGKRGRYSNAANQLSLKSKDHSSIVHFNCQAQQSFVEIYSMDPSKDPAWSDPRKSFLQALSLGF